MTKISLRVYNREIEAMIESGQVDEAIAHCQHILKTFPMHLETYRLLGKGYLETRRYGDAADIFQRVLMSVPEDFVSHVGMSIIRDDESKLDEAIWHMERAFEVQPSNPAIQDELKKLYGRRDGVQPPKVRLTRDALANMYAQGALYSQAIAEIRAVLADDPNRPDLQVMLARAYSKDGRKKQAIEICTELIKKYPYCFDALRILIDLMPPSDQLEFIQTYRLRVRALDPYTGFVTGSIFNSDNVPDTAVNIELLDYDPNGIERVSQPVWANTLGIKLEPEEKHPDIPDWLSEKPSEMQREPSEENLSNEIIGENEATSEVEAIPEWMRSSGWEKTSEQSIENSIFDENEAEKEEPLAKADLPEWLKEIAPDEESLESENFPDGFEKIFDTKGSIEEEKLIEDDLSSVIKASNMENEESEISVPDWLKDDQFLSPIQGETEPTAVSHDLEIEQAEIDPSSSDKVQEVGEEISSQSADELASLLGEDSHEESIVQNEDMYLGRKEDDLPEWLKDIGSDNESFNEEINKQTISKMDDRSEDTLLPEDQVNPEFENHVFNELPDWLKEIESAEDQVLVNDAIAPDLINEAQLSTQNDNGMEFPESMPESEDLRIEDQGNQESEEMSPKFATEIGESSLNEDQEAAMAWLESLAEIEGANEEELLTIKEERSLEPPEWINNSIGEIDDNLVPDKPSSNSDLIVIKKSDVINALNNQESMESELSKAQESAQIFEELAKDEKSEDMERFTSDIDELTGKSSVDQNWSTENGELESLTPTSSVGEDEEYEDITQDEETSNKETENEFSAEIDYSSETDISKWLSDLDQRDTKISEDTITPKEPENYGNEDAEQLPDWLRNMDRGSKTSGWISEPEALSDEGHAQSSDSEISSQEKDIEDIREIFPADDTNWNLEKSESESKFKPKNEEVNPVTSGEWQPVQQEQTIFDQKKSDDFDLGLDIQGDQSIQKRIPAGKGTLSKIPDQGVEKEAGIMELAQGFLESGEIKKALDLYAKLVKKGQLLEGVIHDLRETTYRYPLEIGVWQLLGDAYMRANRLQDALDAYTKAEELLR